jgi:hypothetical protein
VSAYFDGLYSIDDILKGVEPDVIRMIHVETLERIFALIEDPRLRELILESLRLDPWYDGEYLGLASRWGVSVIPEEPRIAEEGEGGRNMLQYGGR